MELKCKSAPKLTEHELKWRHRLIVTSLSEPRVIYLDVFLVTELGDDLMVVLQFCEVFLQYRVLTTLFYEFSFDLG